MFKRLSVFVCSSFQVIMRINYGQNVSISGLAGAVSLAGSGDDLWAVEGGNYQVPAGLIKLSNASLFLNYEVVSIDSQEGSYKLVSSTNERKDCDAVVIATPLDEVPIRFIPKLKLPSRQMQHTYTTFVRGLINPVSPISNTEHPTQPVKIACVISM